MGPTGKALLRADCALGTGHRGAIEVGLGADGTACILHTGVESGALGGQKVQWVCLHNARLGGQNG